MDAVEAIASATGHADEELEDEHSGVVADSFPVRGGAIG